jgi:hypothetical protein
MKHRLPTILGIAASFLFVSCAGTTFYDPKTGKPVARFQGDMSDSHYAGNGVKWDAAKVSHSAATKAGGDVVAKVGTAVVGIAGAAAGL